MIQVTLPNGSQVVTDAPASVFDGVNCNIEDIDYIGSLSYNYLNPSYVRQDKI